MSGSGPLSRDEVRAAIHGHGRAVPRVLHWYNADALAAHGALIRRLGERYPDDIIVAWPRGPDWGLRKRRATASSWAEAYPLADWANFAAWAREHFPDPRRPADFSPVARAVAEHKGLYVLGAWPLGIFERVHALRPMDQVLIDLLEGDRRLERLMDMLTELYVGVAECFAKAGADGFRFTDDWGMQDRMIVRPELWREVFRSRYAAIFARCHELGLDVVFHSCGAIEPILPDLLELEVDVVHPLQPGCVNHERAAAVIGGRMAAAGGVDVQRTLARGRPEQVRCEMRRWVETFYRCGRVVLWPTNTIMPETPPENLQAMFEASEQLRYPGRARD